MTDPIHNHTRFFTFPELDHMELLHAAYKDHCFDRHYHEGHVIGVIEKGSLGFDYQGERLVASAGQINLADPGEVHNGFAVSDQGWQYRMFYLKAGQLDRLCNEVCDKSSPMPYFKKGVIQDRAFAARLLSLHRDFEDPCISLLEKESRFCMLFSGFILKHARFIVRPVAPGLEPAMISRVKAYIQAHFDSRISLKDLGRIAGVSRYYLLRVFFRQVGMTPHAYLNFTRVSKVRQMLRQQVAIADAAVSAGFYDQSHLNRVFKKITGITPGRFAAALG